MTYYSTPQNNIMFNSTSQNGHLQQQRHIDFATQQLKPKKMQAAVSREIKQFFSNLSLTFSIALKPQYSTCVWQVLVEIHVTRLVMCRQPLQKSGSKQPRATQHQHRTQA